MCDRPEASQQNGPCEDACHCVRQSHAMRTVVRNIVANMESVLNDLQGIMGDIQSLVVQIDTVTDKIDQQCVAQADNSSSTTSEYCVRKPEFVHGRKLSAGAVNNALYSHTDIENISADNVRKESDISSHNVLQVKAFRRDNIEGDSGIKQHGRSRPQRNDGPSRRTDIRLPCPSKRFSHFSKDGAGITSPSGSIAIVYPTIKCPPTFNPDVDYLEASDVRKPDVFKTKITAVKASDQTVYFNKCFQEKRNILPRNHQIVSCPTSFQDTESKESVKATAKQKYGIKSVYNKFFQPVTPTEQRSPVIPMAHRHGQTRASGYENPKSLVSSRDSKPYRVSYPIPEKSSIPSSPNHKYCTIGGSLSKSLQAQRDASIQYQRIIPSSPLLRHSSTKAVYNKVHGSPASSRSPCSTRRSGTENYYYSIESDLDSEALIENIDNRTMTPDIDWSYLNLMGNENFQGHASKIPEMPCSDHAYEIPVTSARIHQPFQMLQTSPDVIARLPVINFRAMPAAEDYIGYDSRFLFHEQAVLCQPFNSPVAAHVFCSEVSSFNVSGYCGCYESVLDSILENIAGFESFEDACEELDNEEVLNDTYVSFEDEFEEDDWDVGMKSDDQGEYELPPFNIDVLYNDEHDFFERFEMLDDNRNVFSATDNVLSVKCELFSTDNIGSVVLSGTTEGHNDNVNQKGNKRRLSPVFSDVDVYNRIAFSGATGNSFGDDDCCAIKPNVTNKHENFILLRKTFIPGDLCLFNEKINNIVTDCETEMSSSDDTSCQAIGTGSPMSFSSPEAALTSPDTDRFVTSSEGDDLFTSQEEGYFHFSETQDNANMSVARANMLQLRREFFESLYNVCDKREKERSQNDAKTSPDENVRYDTSFTRMDNSRDNISEAGSYQEEITSYNRNINTWTAYACVHMQPDDISDSTSDIFNDNNVSCSMTNSYLDADNIGTAPGSQGLTC